MSDGMSDARDYGPFLSKHGPPIVGDQGKPVVVGDIDWKARALALAGLVRDLLEIVTTGPCCGSGDENTSHYHCWECGEVGGMMVHSGACPKPDLEYQRKKKLPELVEQACDEILGPQKET